MLSQCETSINHDWGTGSPGAGVPADGFSVRVIADCEQVVSEIETWKKTRIRFDERFDRATSKSLGANWLEAEDKYGVEITLDNSKEYGGRAKFSGKQAIAGFGMTSMTREIPGDDFYAMEATLFPDRVADTEYGLSIYYMKQGDGWFGFHVGLDTLGKVRFNPGATDTRDMDRRDMLTGGGWQEVRGAAPPDPKEITIRVTRGEKNRQSTFTISYWNEAKREWVVAQKDISVTFANTRGNWKVGVFCRAKQGADVSFYVDNIRVYERDRR